MISIVRIKSLNIPSSTVSLEFASKKNLKTRRSKNVCIVPGGRAGLTRVAAVVGDVYTSYSVPEYTVYSNMVMILNHLRAFRTMF